LGLLIVSAPPSVPAARGAEAPDGLPADTLRLEQVVRDVLKQNDDAAAARYMEQASRAKVGPAGAWNDPMLMLGVANLPTSFDFKMDDMTMKMIGLSQDIPYAGEKGLQAKAARAEAGVVTQERRAAEIALATAARLAYLDLYYQRENLEDMRRQRELIRDVVESATAKLRVDQAGQDEVLAAQADLWRLESMILSAEAGVTAAGSTLNSLRGLDPRLNVPPLAAPYDLDVPAQPDSWLREASESYPGLKRLELLSESYGFSAAAAQRMRLPMLGLSANYGVREDGPMGPRDGMVGFQATLSLPVFAGRQQGQMARSMRAMQRSVEAEARQLRREIQADLVTLHDRAQRLSKSLALYREQIVPADEDAYRSGLAGYATNRTSFVALLTYAGAVYRDRIAANQLANELGKTLAEAESYTVDPAIWVD
jgi:outer membrane protein TolC